MPLIEAFTVAACFGILVGIVRFSALAFWPDHMLTQAFTGRRAR